MIPSQMLKGTLEGSILAIISVQDSYGYEISRQLEKFGFGNISEGTIYPLLLRLEKNGLISATYRESGRGPKRKYYRLSDPGKDELQQFFDSFEELDQAVHRLVDYLKEEHYEQ